jgi:hypothetical protein
LLKDGLAILFLRHGGFGIELKAQFLGGLPFSQELGVEGVVQLSRQHFLFFGHAPEI